jgi:hypothetical protein
MPKSPSGSTRSFDVLILAASALLLALLFALVPRLPDPLQGWLVTQFLLGFVLCPLLILLVIRHGYLIARGLYWPARRRREEEHVRELGIPDAVRKAETFDGVGTIDAAEKAALAAIPDPQGLYRARTLTLYAVPAVAVLLAGLQLALWPAGPFGAGLLLGQALLVCFAILNVMTDRRPTQEWIERRTRGELLRREQYLCLARVGPYAEGRLTRPESRIAQIGGAKIEQMDELLLMEYDDDPDRATWLEALSSRPVLAPIFDDLAERVTTYQYRRAGKQMAWMRSAAEDSESTARRLQRLVIVGALCTGLIALVNAIFLPLKVVPHGVGQPEESSVWLQSAVALGTFLPAFSGMLLALHSVFDLRSLSENYRMTERSLERLRKELIELQDEVLQTAPNADPARRCQLERRFQKLVLRVESELTEEYFRWRMVTQRDAHELV